MADTSLLKFIEDSRKAGSRDSEIRSSLEKVGWQSADVNQAFSELESAVQIKKEAPQLNRVLAPADGSFTSPSSSSNWKIWGIVAVSLFIFAAGGAYGAWYYFELPERAFADMPNAFQKIDNFSYRIKVNLESISGKKEKGVSSLKAFLPAGVALLAQGSPMPPSFEQNNLSFKADFDMSGSYEIPKEKNIPNFSTELNGEIEAGGMAIKFSGELRSIDEIFYFNLSNFPGLFQGQLGDFQLKKWYSLKQETFKELEFFPESAMKSSRKTEEITKKTTELYKKYILFDISNARREKLSDGTPVYVFQLKPRKKELLSFLEELQKIQKESEDIQTGSALEEKKFNENFVDGLSKGEISYKISRSGHFLREAEFNMPEIEVEGQKMSTDIKIEISDINKSKVEKPLNSFSYDDVLKKMLDDTKKKARDARRIADISQIRLALELDYDAHNKYPASLLQIDRAYLPQIPMDPTGGQYFYAKTKKGYHLGANLELKGSYLETDADNKTGFDGSDTKGCKGETDRYCFDVVSP